jgi:hypothetical protein
VHELNSFLPLTSFDFFSAFVIRTQVRWIFPADIFRFLFPITVFRAACRSSSPFLILSCQEIFQLKSLLPAEFGSCRSPVLVFLRRSVRRLVGLVIPKGLDFAGLRFFLAMRFADPGDSANSAPSPLEDSSARLRFNLTVAA